MSELEAVQVIQIFSPKTGMGRSLPIDRLNLYVRLQYFQDIQGLAENDRVAVQIGPSRDFPDITA